MILRLLFFYQNNNKKYLKKFISKIYTAIKKNKWMYNRCRDKQIRGHNIIHKGSLERMRMTGLLACRYSRFIPQLIYISHHKIRFVFYFFFTPNPENLESVPYSSNLFFYFICPLHWYLCFRFRRGRKDQDLEGKWTESAEGEKKEADAQIEWCDAGVTHIRSYTISMTTSRGQNDSLLQMPGPRVGR